MIIIRKPRRKSWKGMMSSYLMVACHAFELSNICRRNRDIDGMYEAALKGWQNLHRAANAGGFFKVNDMFKWVERETKRAKRS